MRVGFHVVGALIGPNAGSLHVDLGMADLLGARAGVLIQDLEEYHNLGLWIKLDELEIGPII